MHPWGRVVLVQKPQGDDVAADKTYESTTASSDRGRLLLDVDIGEIVGVHLVMSISFSNEFVTPNGTRFCASATCSDCESIGGSQNCARSVLIKS